MWVEAQGYVIPLFFLILFWKGSCLHFPSPISEVSSVSCPWMDFGILAALCLEMQWLPCSGLILALPEPQNLGVHLPTWGLLLGSCPLGQESHGKQQGLNLGGFPFFP